MRCAGGEQALADTLHDCQIQPRHGDDANTAGDTVSGVDVQTALGRYLAVADAVAPGMVEGLYVVGSYALGDWIEGASDIDVVIVAAEPATDDDFERVCAIHAQLADDDDTPLRIDGPYLAWGDLIIEPATGLYRPWTLDGVPRHDGECFEINPITWYTLAAHGVTVRGPAAQRLGIPTDVEARIRFVSDNLRSYWKGLAAQVAAACERPEPPAFDAPMLVWCALGALRLHCTAFTGEVVSKRGAGEYGLTVAPAALHPVLHTALAMRAAGEHGDVTPAMMRDAAAVISWCVTDVESAMR